jgi:hypothetical protein
MDPETEAVAGRSNENRQTMNGELAAEFDAAMLNRWPEECLGRSIA